MAASGGSEHADFPIRLIAGGQGLMVQGGGPQQQFVQQTNLAVHLSDGLNQIGKPEQGFQAEIEPVERGDAGGQSVPRLSTQFVRSG